MGAIKKIFDFYIDSSIHVAVEVCCFALVTCLHFDLPFDWFFLGFIFFGTITGYNFIKYAELAKFRHRSLEPKLKVIQVFSLICFLAFLYFVTQLPFKTLLVAAFFGIFTIFYAVPFLPGYKNLRSIQGIKIFVIAFVVSGLTMIVPLFHHERYQEAEVAFAFIQRITFIIAVIIPFDIRDLNFDDKRLKTIPQRLGVKKAKMLAITLLGVFLILGIIDPVNTVYGTCSSLIIALIAAGFVWASSAHQSAYFASFWVDAIPIFWFLEYGLLLKVFA